MKSVVLTLTGVTLSVFLGSCAAVGTSPGSPTPTPPAPVGHYPNARVLTDPSGSVTLARGDQVVIVLTTPAGYQPWGRIFSNNLDVVAPLYPPVPGSGGSAATALTALDAGHTTLHANTAVDCRPPAALPPGQGYACPAVARIWTLDVSVLAGPRRPASIDFPLPSGPQSIHLLVGDQLTLSAGLTDVRVSPTGPLDARGRNPDGSQTLQAVAPGSVLVQALTDAPCLHATPACAIAVMELRIEVVVRSSY